MKRILLTGGSGFIGSHTSLVLLEKGYELIVLDSHVNSSPNPINRVKDLVRLKNKDLYTNIQLFEGDIRDDQFLKKIFLDSREEGKSIEAVIHFAGLKSVAESISDPLLYWESNVSGTIELLKVMKEFDCRTMIFSSSATIYGLAGSELINEDSDIRPINPYGRTKAAVEQLLNDVFYSNPGNWRVANLRYFNPIGAHPSGSLGEDPLGIPNNIFPIITRVASGQIKELQIYGNDWDTPDGTGVRDYIHVMDLAEGHVSALEYLLEQKPQIINLNLGTAIGTSVLELVNTFQKVNNIKVPYVFVDRRKGDIPITIADNSLSLSTLNWSPRRNLIEMCRDGWAWQDFLNRSSQKKN